MRAGLSTRKCDLYLQALGSRRYSKAVDLYFLFSRRDCRHQFFRLQDGNDPPFAGLGREEPRGELPFEEKSFNSIQDDLVMLGARYGALAVWSFFRMTPRALTTMDASMGTRPRRTISTP